MNRIRTSLLALTLASVAVTTGVVATSASAGPAALAAVGAVTTAPSPTLVNAALADGMLQVRQHGILHRARHGEAYGEDLGGPGGDPRSGPASRTPTSGGRWVGWTTPNGRHCGRR